MTAPSPPLVRGPSERLAARVVTGPPGHLWSAAADLTVFGLRLLGDRCRRRADPRRRPRAGVGG